MFTLAVIGLCFYSPFSETEIETENAFYALTSRFEQALNTMLEVPRINLIS